MLYNKRVLVPQSWRQAVLRWVHVDNTSSAHQEGQKTWAKIKKQYYWLIMRKDVADLLLGCNICLQAESRQVEMELKHLEAPQGKFEIISKDICDEGALSVLREGRMILTIIDRLTNFVQLMSLHKKNWKRTGLRYSDALK